MLFNIQCSPLWAIQVLRNAVGGGRVYDFTEKTRYEDVRSNIISGGGGLMSNFQKKALCNT